MSTITAVLEADADGTLHVPLPEELRGVKIKITATIEAAERTAEEQRASRHRVQAAIKRLQERGNFEGVDAVSWQRDLRADRPLPGREE